MKKDLPRPISPTEGALVSRMLSAPGAPLAPPDEVTGICECGCATIHFMEDTRGARVARDAIGRTPAGVEVGAILWGKDGKVASLEIYTLGTDTSELPTPDSLQFDPLAPAS